VHLRSAVLGNAAFLRSWAGRRLKASLPVGAHVNCPTLSMAARHERHAPGTAK
jgi:hypothetical protein